MEAMWDELLREEAEIDSPKWHEEVLDVRIRKVEAGEGEFLSLDELKVSRDSRGFPGSPFCARLRRT